MRKNFHFILQGKGGVGKTTISCFLAQYVKYNLNQDCLCIDTDQVNGSFSHFEALEVEKLLILEDNNINQRGWDTLIEKLLTTDKSNIIVDNGASSFVPLIGYAVENNVFDFLTDNENEEKGFEGNLYIHVPISGGEGLHHTIAGVEKICKTFDNELINIIVWNNPYHGPIEINGKQFIESDIYKKYKERITVLTLPKFSKETFGEDIREMLEKHRTFNEVINSNTVSVMSRHRYRQVEKTIYKLIDDIRYMFSTKQTEDEIDDL